ncbi:ABC transporter ATP-binding protein [Lysinibacillus sp. M3]|uniref:ABC transporter ATP-binding protein n=1 Tax=Lysinibacillus zambalensis TaxID=3160866 RepID=A0ABV1MNQ5_9BACI
MKNLIKDNIGFVIVTLFLTIFTALLTVSVPLLLSNVFKKNYQLNYQTLLWIIVFMIITYTIQIFMVIIRENFAKKFNSNYAKNLYGELHKMKYDSILSKEPTYLIERIGQSIDFFYMFISNSLVGIISNNIIIIIALFLIFKINLMLGILLLLLIPLNYLGFKAINKELHKKSMIMQKETAQGYKELVSIFKNVDMVKQERNINRINNLIEPSLEKIYHTRAKVNKFGQSSSLIIKLINNFVQNLLFFILAFMIYTNQTSVNDLIIVSILLPIFFTALQGFTNVNLEFRDIQVSKEFIIEELLAEKEQDGSEKLNQIKSISFHSVKSNIGKKTFVYNIKGDYVKGDIVFVKGASGAGKSSLMKLLLKFRESEGIFINGLPINKIENYSLRDKIFYLSQDTAILPFSMKENILFGKKDSNIDWSKIQNSKLLKSILTNGKSLDMKIYEYGTNLSGGEKQRIMLSRLLVEDFDVIILDEVTSNIDKESQELIYKTLLNDYKEKIVFIISHDLYNEKYCNKTINISPNRN